MRSSLYPSGADFLSGLGQSVSGLEDSPSNDSVKVKPVRFTPFRINLWRRGKAGLLTGFLDSKEAEDVSVDYEDLELLVGRYILTFSYTSSNGERLESSDPIPFSIMGKKAEIEKFKIDPDKGQFILQVHLIENPIPIIALIIAGAAAVGVAGYGVYKALDSLDRVVLDVTDSLLWTGLLFGAGWVGYKLIFK